MIAISGEFVATIRGVAVGLTGWGVGNVVGLGAVAVDTGSAVVTITGVFAVAGAFVSMVDWALHPANNTATRPYMSVSLIEFCIVVYLTDLNLTLASIISP